MAYQGKHQEAAKIYAGCGQVKKAVEMFADLRQWEYAKKWALTSNAIDLTELIRLQAQWAEETGDWKGAVEMWMAASSLSSVVQLMV